MPFFFWAALRKTEQKVQRVPMYLQDTPARAYLLQWVSPRRYIFINQSPYFTSGFSVRVAQDRRIMSVHVTVLERRVSLAYPGAGVLRSAPAPRWDLLTAIGKSLAPRQKTRICSMPLPQKHSPESCQKPACWGTAGGALWSSSRKW